MSAAQDRAREWLTGMGNWNPGIIRASQGPEIVRDLLAELDQAQVGRDMWARTADALGGNMEDVGHILSGVRYDEAEDVYRAANRVVAERDAALATLAEVREWRSKMADTWVYGGPLPPVWELLSDLDDVLDRGPR